MYNNIPHNYDSSTILSQELDSHLAMSEHTLKLTQLKVQEEEESLSKLRREILQETKILEQKKFMVSYMYD